MHGGPGRKARQTRSPPDDGENRQGPAEVQEEGTTRVRRFRADLLRGFRRIRAARISATRRAEYAARSRASETP